VRRRFLAGLLLLTFACHRAQPRLNVVIQRGYYNYMWVSDTTVHIHAADDPRALEAALKEIGCGAKYVCAQQPNGKMWIIVATPK
jgi:hypothetical protein